MVDTPMQYEVALSFAGEHRVYVRDVARFLQAKGVAIFFDEFELLWGQDGSEYFWKVFSEQSKFIVMFISKEYANKKFTNLERRAALANPNGRILPVRFDDTNLPGLSGDLIYEKASALTPAEIAGKIGDVLGIEPFSGKASSVPPPHMTSPRGEAIFDYSSHNGRYIIGEGVLQFETAWTKASDRSIHVYNDPASINGVAVAPGLHFDLTGFRRGVLGLHLAHADASARAGCGLPKHTRDVRGSEGSRRQGRHSRRRS